MLAGAKLSAVIVAAPPEAICGVPVTPQQTKRCRVISSETHPTVPVSSAAVSATRSFQVPATNSPFRTESGVSGRNVPANGAVPAPIAVAAPSSKIVCVPEQSFAPVP